MKNIVIVYQQPATGPALLFAAEHVSTFADGNTIYVRPLDSHRHLAVDADLCAPLEAAHDAYVLLPAIKALLAEAQARAVTPPASPALDASQPPAPSPEMASVATEPGGDSATAAGSSSVTPPALPLL